MRDQPTQRVQRLLFMRQFPGFADAEVSELAAFAENAIERVHPAGTLVAGPGRPAAIHMVVEGRLATLGGERTWRSRQGVGALEVIAGRRALEPVVAAVDTRTLEIAADDFRELLADNLSVLMGARRLLAARLLASATAGASMDAVAPDVGAIVVDGASAQIDAVRRLQLVRRTLPFPGGFIQALAALGRAAVDERLDAGAILQMQGERAEAMTILVHGMAQLVAPAGEAGKAIIPGRAFGRLETLAATSYASTVEARTPVRVLRVPATAMVDVMEDHTDFALALIAQLASAVLQLEGRHEQPN